MKENNNEIIEELDCISDMRNELNELSEKKQNVIDDSKTKIAEIYTAYEEKCDNISNDNETIINRCPKTFGWAPSVYPFRDAVKGNPRLGAICLVVAVVAGIISPILTKLHIPALPTISSAIAAICIVIFGVQLSVIKDFKSKIESNEKWNSFIKSANPQREDNRFYDECAKYDKSFRSYVDTVHNQFLSLFEDFKKEKTALYYDTLDDFEDVQLRINTLTDRLNESKLLEPELQYLAPYISRYLKSGQSDTFEEALQTAMKRHPIGGN